MRLLRVILIFILYNISLPYDTCNVFPFHIRLEKKEIVIYNLHKVNEIITALLELFDIILNLN